MIPNFLDTGNEEIVEDNGIEEGHSDNIITHDSDYFEGAQLPSDNLLNHTRCLRRTKKR